jgi:hypothetical protein
MPECGGEECKDGEDLQPAQEHTDGEYEAAQRVDDLEALRGADLSQARPYVVQGRRHGGGTRERGQLLLQGDEESRYPENPDPGREEPEDGDPHGLWNHASV